jgi:hypothetical protein
MLNLLVFFASVAVHVGVSVGARPGFGPGSNLLGIASGELVAAITPAQWKQALDKPNATGHFPVQGYDISQPYPVGHDFVTPIDGWSLDINITADISLENADPYPGYSWPPQSYFTGINVRFNPPASLVTTSPNGSSAVRFDKSTWAICMTVIWPEGLPQAALDAGKNDNGSCTSMFGEDCVRDIRSTWAGAYRMGQSCPLPPMPPSCGKADSRSRTSFCKSASGDQRTLATPNSQHADPAPSYVPAPPKVCWQQHDRSRLQ